MTRTVTSLSFSSRTSAGTAGLAVGPKTVKAHTALSPLPSCDGRCRKGNSRAKSPKALRPVDSLVPTSLMSIGSALVPMAETARVASAGGNSTAVAPLEALRARLVTAGGAYPEPMLVDQLSNIARMAGSADQKVGRSAFEYLAELEKELAAIKTEAGRLGA